MSDKVHTSLGLWTGIRQEEGDKPLVYFRNLLQRVFVLKLQYKGKYQLTHQTLLLHPTIEVGKYIKAQPNNVM